MNNKIYTPENFPTIDPALLTFARSCHKGHIGPDGQGVRYLKGSPKGNNECAACKHRLPIGAFEHQFVGPTPARVWPTEEEKAKRRSEASARYNARNPERHREHVKKYSSKPEVKARRAETDKAWYEANKEKIKADRAAYYLANKERCTALQRERYYRDKAKDKE